jgi:hypothetical protein
MRGWRVYPAVLLTVALAGCGSGAERPQLAPPAEPRTIELGWVERFRAASFVFRVGRLVVGDDGWRASVSVTNDSQSPYRLGRRSVALVVLETASRRELRELTEGLERTPPSLPPDTVSPEPPPVLGPGASWTAELSSTVVLRSGSVVRVLFGPFSRVGGRDREAADVLWVTDHAARL